MLCLSGTQTGSISTVGATSSGEIGFATSATESTSALVATLNPGKQPTWSVGCLYVLFCVGMMGVALLVSEPLAGVLILTIVGSIVWAFNDHQSKAEQMWQEKKRVHDGGWICHQCGHVWIPETESVDAKRTENAPTAALPDQSNPATGQNSQSAAFDTVPLLLGGFLCIIIVAIGIYIAESKSAPAPATSGAPSKVLSDEEREALSKKILGSKQSK